MDDFQKWLKKDFKKAEKDYKEAKQFKSAFLSIIFENMVVQKYYEDYLTYKKSKGKQ